MPSSLWPRRPTRPGAESGIPVDHEPGTVTSSEERSAGTPGPRRASLGSAAVAGVAFAAGLLFATNASLFSSGEQRNPQNLVELARAETDRLEEQEETNARLRQEIDALIAAQPVAPADVFGGLVSQSIGREAVEGPGIEVQLWDAPVPPNGLGELHPDDLVVHQQDLEAVMNALWSGGAEAMTIQGQRITPTSGVRCVGNVLFLHGRTYSPPYVVQAIGNPDRLEKALGQSRGVQIYRQYVDAVGLGWSMTHLEHVEMPAYSGSMTLQHAEVIEDDAAEDRTVLEPFGRDPEDV